MGRLREFFLSAQPILAAESSLQRGKARQEGSAFRFSDPAGGFLGTRPSQRNGTSRRGVGWSGLAIALGAMLLPTAAWADSVATRAEIGQGFGRLIFDWPKDVDYSVNLAGRRLFIDFSRPVSTDLNDAVATLSAYVVDAGLANGGRRLTLDLTGDYSINTDCQAQPVSVDILADRQAGAGQIVCGVVEPLASNGNDIMDILPPEPERQTAAAPQPTRQARPAPRSQPTRQAAAPARRQGPRGTVRVRAGDHPEFSRLVFDWPRRVDYEVAHQTSSAAIISFGAGARLQDEAVLTAGLRQLLRYDPRSDRDSVVVSLAAPQGGEVKTFRLGNRVVVDLYGPPPGYVPASAPHRRDIRPAAYQPGHGETFAAPARRSSALMDQARQRPAQPSHAPFPEREVGGHTPRVAQLRPDERGMADAAPETAPQRLAPNAPSARDRIGAYVVGRLGGGYLQMRDVDIGNTYTVLSDSEDDYIFNAGLAVGYDFGSMGVPVRLEAEYGYHGGGRYESDLTTPNTRVESDLSSHVVMANAALDFAGPLAIDESNSIVPYLMAGVGGAWHVADGEISNGTTVSLESTTEGSVAWSIGGGVAVRLTQDLVLDTRYRFMDLAASWDGNCNSCTSFVGNIYEHEATLGVRYEF